MRLYDKAAFDFGTAIDSHWRATAEPLGQPLGQVEGALSHDAVIVGAGFTGLSCALRLARDHGMNVAVVDAARPGWGASGRNGGFCCIGSSKMSMSQMIGKFGLDETRAFFDVQRRAIEHVRGVLERYGIDADTSEPGEVQMAHKDARVDSLKAEQAYMAKTFGVESEFLSPDELRGIGLFSPQFKAGLRSSLGFGLHPMKYVLGLARVALDAGVTIYCDSPVSRWREEAGRQILVTPGGEVSGRTVLFATNGYTDEAVPEWIGGRILPALSRILVTRPITADEQAAQGYTSTVPTYDSRTLLHYFRLLPDGRVMFGGRGGTDASPAATQAAGEKLRRDFDQMFPAWTHVETAKSWSGLVCLMSGLLPYAGPVGDAENAWFCGGYHGNGVAMGSYSGTLMADVIANAKSHDEAFVPIMRQPLEKFPVPAARVALLKLAYLYYGAQDRFF